MGYGLFGLFVVLGLLVVCIPSMRKPLTSKNKD